MLKLQEQPTPPQHLAICSLIKQIKLKLGSLGYNSLQINQQLLNTAKKVLKLKSHQPRQLKKILLHKPLSKINHKILSQLLIELDLYLHSIHDNYDSDTEHPQRLKLQNVPSKETVEPCPLPVQSNKFRFKASRYFDDSSFVDRVGRKTMVNYFGESIKNRQLFDRVGRMKEVRLVNNYSDDDLL